MVKDLTVGKPSNVLWRFCLPMFGSIVFQQLYNIADSLVAGQFIGENALAAVGNAYEITLLFLAVSFGCNIGCSVIAAQNYGAKQYGQMKTAVFTALIAAAALCLTLMLLGFLSLDALLQWIKTPENVFSDCKAYLRIYILSLPFVFFYNVATGIFTALGDSKTPFYFLAFSSLANIGMDILFVTVFSMGVPGVAWATLICQGISCMLSILLVLKKNHSDPFRAFFHILGEYAEKIHRHRRSQYASAIVHFHWQHYDPGNHQPLRLRSYGRLFGGSQAEQSGDHILYHNRKRHFQLLRAKYGSRICPSCKTRVSCRIKNGLAHQHSADTAVFLWRTVSDPAVPGIRNRNSI